MVDFEEVRPTTRFWSVAQFLGAPDETEPGRGVFEKVLVEIADLMPGGGVVATFAASSVGPVVRVGVAGGTGLEGNAFVPRDGLPVRRLFFRMTALAGYLPMPPHQPETRGLVIEVVHPIEILERASRGDGIEPSERTGADRSA